jgi:hypothetical protein
MDQDGMQKTVFTKKETIFNILGSYQKTMGSVQVSPKIQNLEFTSTQPKPKVIKINSNLSKDPNLFVATKKRIIRKTSPHIQIVEMSDDVH